MDEKHRALRTRLQKMAPRRATEYVAAFELKAHEAFCIVECDVRGRSCQQVADTLHASQEYVKKCRRNGYGKIIDAVNNQ